MKEDRVDFQRIQQGMAIERVLAHYQVQLRRSSRVDLRGACPLPTHSSPKSRNSFSVNLIRNAWCCLSASCVAARSGYRGGNVIDFVAQMEQCSIYQAACHLRDWFGSPSAGRELLPAHHVERELSEANGNVPLGFALHNIDPGHSYLSSRRIHNDTARFFGIGMYSGKGFLQGKIVIPVHNEQNQLIAYAGRAVDSQEPKYRFPTGFKKSQVLFNLNRALGTQQRTVIVVEGFFDTFQVHQAGQRTVVALMGTSLSPTQADLLGKYFDHVILMLDSDAAGRSATTAIAHALQPRLTVTPIQLEEGRQPDQLTAKQIHELVARWVQQGPGQNIGYRPIVKLPPDRAHI